MQFSEVPNEIRWEHLLWSRWSVVHYHTEPGSERWHWSEVVFILPTAHVPPLILSSCAFICGREVFLWVWEHWTMGSPVVPRWPSVGLTGVCKWEHLLWSWWSMVHYHTEPGSEWWHWSGIVLESTINRWGYRHLSTWSVCLLIPLSWWHHTEVLLP